MFFFWSNFATICREHFLENYRDRFQVCVLTIVPNPHLTNRHLDKGLCQSATSMIEDQPIKSTESDNRINRYNSHSNLGDETILVWNSWISLRPGQVRTVLGRTANDWTKANILHWVGTVRVHKRSKAQPVKIGVIKQQMYWRKRKSKQIGGIAWLSNFDSLFCSNPRDSLHAPFLSCILTMGLNLLLFVVCKCQFFKCEKSQRMPNRSFILEN